MTPTEIQTLIQLAKDACVAKEGKAFASLFSTEAELIVGRDRVVGRGEIEAISTEYFRTCHAVTITIHRTIVSGDRAVVEWTWEAIAKGKRDRSDNAIVMDFQAGFIARWREYTSPNLSPASQ